MQHQRAIEALGHALRREYGDAISRVIVFGSVARHEDHEGSDIDVMVVMDSEKLPVDWELERAIRSVAFAVELQRDVVFDLKVVAVGDWYGLKGHTPFMERVAEEGVTV